MHETDDKGLERPAADTAALSLDQLEAKPYLDTDEAERFFTLLGLPLSKPTLEKMRVAGTGPEYVKWGRYPRYIPPALRAYAEARLSGPLKSTSDTGGRDAAA